MNNEETLIRVRYGKKAYGPPGSIIMVYANTEHTISDLRRLIVLVKNALDGEIDIRIVDFESLPYGNKGYVIPVKEQNNAIQFMSFHIESYGDNIVERMVDEIRRRKDENIAREDFDVLDISVADEGYGSIIGRFRSKEEES